MPRNIEQVPVRQAGVQPAYLRTSVGRVLLEALRFVQSRFHLSNAMRNLVYLDDVIELLTDLLHRENTLLCSVASVS